MMSLSKEWALLSKAIYGQNFIDELAGFLKQNNVKSILECGCGDGYILNGLAKHGLKGVGVDKDAEMISMALKYKPQNIEYKQMDWLDLDNLAKTFDAVMCRGNSLTYVNSWNTALKDFNPEKARKSLEKSIGKMLGRLKEDGLLYVDTISNDEIRKKGGKVEIELGGISLKGKIKHDWKKRIRYISGDGKIGDEAFNGEAISYLIRPEELASIIKKFNPSGVYTKRLLSEKNYDIIFTIK